MIRPFHLFIVNMDHFKHGRKSNLTWFGAFSQICKFLFLDGFPDTSAMQSKCLECGWSGEEDGAGVFV